MTEFLAILSGILKFWDEVVYLVRLLQRSPTEKHADLLNALAKAIDKATNTGDTSDVEDVIHNG